MKLSILVVLCSIGLVSTQTNRDQFRYDYGMNQDGRIFGQDEWRRVTCRDVDTCTGYLDKFPDSIGWNIQDKGNQCRWCPEGQDKCAAWHRQSPINLLRNFGDLSDPDLGSVCIDWHWMHYEDDTCSWDDMRDSFSIEPHALRISTPTTPNGDIACVEDGRRTWPRIDYSKGFPNWWWLQYTQIKTPSEHLQHGRRYPAEVTMQHFYELDFTREMGYVTVFMDDRYDDEPWPYLDKLICAWRAAEEEKRSSCGLPPAEPYGRCKLFRSQEPTRQWLAEAGLLTNPSPTPSPTSTPSAKPSTSPSEPPSTEPSGKPSASPSSPPEPTVSPSDAPSTAPSGRPSTSPSSPPEPTSSPSAAPSTLQSPSATPSTIPSKTPPSFHPTMTPTVSPSKTPSTPPSMKPSEYPTNSPSTPPSAIANGESMPSEAELARMSFQCRDRPVDYNRMCHSIDPCCESTRSDTNYCWDIYDNILPETEIAAACYHCCPNENKLVGPPNPEKDGLEKTIECSARELNPQRWCKATPDSCCNNPFGTNFCRSVVAAVGLEKLQQTCWYCCREPIDVPSQRRSLASNSTIYDDEPLLTLAELIESKENDIPEMDAGIQEDVSTDAVPAGAVVYEHERGRYIMRKENFEKHEDEDAYFEEMRKDHHQRNLAGVVHEEDYENIEWFPYEWLIKVGTEYYWRYEGTQTVPPCRDVVHWRIMKDPIRIAKRQMRELERLLAWRLDDSCKVDTAGRLSPDGNSTNVARDVQYTDYHRKTFCECKNWPSKFEGDQRWCRRWWNDTDHDRFYKRPYNWCGSGGCDF